MTVAEFLLMLVNSPPEFIAAFRENPDRIMEEAGVDEEGRRLLTTGSIDEVRFEIKTSLKAGGEAASIVWIHHIPWLHLDQSS
jgi:hypothetical protein